MSCQKEDRSIDLTALSRLGTSPLMLTLCDSPVSTSCLSWCGKREAGLSEREGRGKRSLNFKFGRNNCHGFGLVTGLQQFVRVFYSLRSD
jgi:hypothetical protein